MILTFFCFKFQDQIISMRKSIGIVLSILLFLQVIAQQNTIDSLHQLLMTTKEDTARINLLNLIAARYQQSNPDSIMKYSNEALAMSLKMNYVEGEVNAMRYQSAAFVLAGNFSTALEIALEALQKSEALGDKKLMARCLNSVGGVYAEQGDVRQAQIYALKMKDIYEQANDQPRLAGSLLNIGYGYGQVNQLDSARIYINRSLDISLRIKDDNMIAVAYLNLGMIHIKLKQYDIAAAYLKQAMPQFIKTYNLSFLYSTYFYLAEILIPPGIMIHLFTIAGWPIAMLTNRNFTK
jgi:tetratricopeptide (TPR) repeat protein